MIKNQRAYQLAYSKSHIGFLSYAVGACAKFAGIAACKLLSAIKKEYVCGNADEARAELEKLCPKPKHDTAFAPIQKAAENVDISVIIPAYNAEKYVNECVDSVLRQKTKYSFEVVIVNDESIDSTLEKLEQYKSVQNVKIIDLEKGGTAAKARNAGLIHSVGKHIVFADSDDVLCENALEVLMNALIGAGADVAAGGWQYIDENGVKGNVQQYCKAVYTGKNKNSRFELAGTPWGKMYKRELFENVRFPSEYGSFEDGIIHFLVFRNAKTVVSVDENVYLWRKNSAGLTQTTQNSKKAILSFWLAEELLEKDKELQLAHDDMFAVSLTGQLANFCYVNISKLDDKTKQNVFVCCCDLFERYLKNVEYANMPYALRLAAKALGEKRFDLWKLQGKFYQLIR